MTGSLPAHLTVWSKQRTDSASTRNTRSANQEMESTMKLRSLLPGVSFCLIAFCCSYAQQTAPTAAQIAQQELQRATALLSLTADQQTAALAIFTAEATSEVTLQASSSTLNKTLDTAITSGDVSGITTTAASIGTLEGQLT